MLQATAGGKQGSLEFVARQNWQDRNRAFALNENGIEKKERRLRMLWARIIIGIRNKYWLLDSGGRRDLECLFVWFGCLQYQKGFSAWGWEIWGNPLVISMVVTFKHCCSFWAPLFRLAPFLRDVHLSRPRVSQTS